jgi:hypothetical protein
MLPLKAVAARVIRIVMHPDSLRHAFMTSLLCKTAREAFWVALGFIFSLSR